VSAALQCATEAGYFPPADASVRLHQKPVALIYDSQAWESGLRECAGAFGPGCLHAIAVKSNPVAALLSRALALGFGAETASIGEVVHAQAVGFPAKKIFFDSPCKTRAELAFALKHGISINIDNFGELDRVAELQRESPGPLGMTIGLRINPLAGAGEIEALSVSVADSKFGIPITFSEKIIQAYSKYEWLNSMHVHTGSGGMGLQTLVQGVRTAADMATAINKQLGRSQVTVLDIGGGLPVNYESEAWGSEKVPTFREYADALRQGVPGLLATEGGVAPSFTVVTEFGQSLNAKSGFLASRVEYLKPTSQAIADAGGTQQVAVVHFGADLCVRQCYTSQHERRLEVYDGVSFSPKAGRAVPQHIAGPLCFQGDMLAKDLMAPQLVVGDFVVMRDAGSNCLSLFSRHCSRQAPVVLGFQPAQGGTAAALVELKPAETLQEISAFWGLVGSSSQGPEQTMRSRVLVGAESTTRRRSGEDPEDADSDDVLLQVARLFASGQQKLPDLLARLLCVGGDERIVLDAVTQMNKYCTQPRPTGGVHRGSCTSSVPTKEAFHRGQDVLRRLILECRAMLSARGNLLYASPKDLFQWLLHDVRERLRTVFHLSMADCISLFPSGTDAELLPALMAIGRCLTRGHGPFHVLSVVTAAGEVGSGTVNAASGKHFSTLLPSGQKSAQVGSSAQVFDVPSAMITVQEVLVRDSAGNGRTPFELDREVEDIVQSALESVDGATEVTEIGCVVVHMVIGSKTGQCIPSRPCFERLAARYGERVLLVVDACQARMGEWTVREHLDMGHIVLTTGSKFFGGPPFAGVCLTPWSLTQELEQILSQDHVRKILSQGHLDEYLIASLLSSDMPNLRALLPENPLNYGLLIRWTLALHEMEAYFIETSELDRTIIMKTWSDGVRDIVKSDGQGLVEYFEEEVAPGNATIVANFGAEAAAALGTIVCFTCHCRRDGMREAKAMGTEELRVVQRLMATDLTAPLKGLQGGGEVAAASTRCFMGQPVSMSKGLQVLRVAASAPLVCRIHNEGLETVLAEDRLLFQKLGMILANWDLLQKVSAL